MKKINTIKRYVPLHVKKILRYLFYLFEDVLSSFSGSRDTLLPPKRMIFIGDGDFKRIGAEFFNYFIELGQLKKTDYVLDVGCGIGRMAVPLIEYLATSAEYQGFDIVKTGIDWCKKNISSKFPQFKFQVADVYNKLYNRKGNYIPSEYKFPYNDTYFDFVFLTSVFTHMYSKDVENYMEEISRVTKKNGRCLISFFLINDESKKYIENGISDQNFKFIIDNNSFTTNQSIPELAIAFSEDYIRDLFARNNFSIIHPIHFGSWCGRQNYKSYQDIIIAQKTN